MAFGVLVIIDKSKYRDYRALFLHKSTSVGDILTYNPDISTYFTFETELEARKWFGLWYQSNGHMLHIPLNEYKFIEILPGINTRGYLPGTDCKEEMRYNFI